MEESSPHEDNYKIHPLESAEVKESTAELGNSLGDVFYVFSLLV